MIRSSVREYHTLRIELLQELYAKGALCGPVDTHRAPIRRELYAALQGIILQDTFFC